MLDKRYSLYVFVQLGLIVNNFENNENFTIITQRRLYWTCMHRKKNAYNIFYASNLVVTCSFSIVVAGEVLWMHSKMVCYATMK